MSSARLRTVDAAAYGAIRKKAKMQLAKILRVLSRAALSKTEFKKMPIGIVSRIEFMTSMRSSSSWGFSDTPTVPARDSHSVKLMKNGDIDLGSASNAGIAKTNITGLSDAANLCHSSRARFPEMALC